MFLYLCNVATEVLLFLLPSTIMTTGVENAGTMVWLNHDWEDLRDCCLNDQESWVQKVSLVFGLYVSIKKSSHRVMRISCHSHWTARKEWFSLIVLHYQFKMTQLMIMFDWVTIIFQMEIFKGILKWFRISLNDDWCEGHAGNIC